jgi:hypothetical protein
MDFQLPSLSVREEDHASPLETFHSPHIHNYCPIHISLKDDLNTGLIVWKICGLAMKKIPNLYHSKLKSLGVGTGTKRLHCM